MPGRRPGEFREGEVIRHATTRTVTVRFPVQTMARNPTLFGAVTAEVQPVDADWTDIRDLDGRAAVSPASARSIRRRCR
ncbi:hypothetical protein [uncultured Salipiger sp.]|uniref:hypothetical protein n=1 Tax=uncultured Salipiger sp. TaxID=499810 RepID=UPI002593203E|nr:hypothetical protein [uncultured Salipiger sp.]